MRKKLEELDRVSVFVFPHCSGTDINLIDLENPSNCSFLYEKDARQSPSLIKTDESKKV